MMIISISGSPGVGKSKVATLLAKRLDAQVISITALVKAHKIPSTLDHKRKTRIIAVKDAQRAVDKIISAAKLQKRTISKIPSERAITSFVVEGHIAHLLRSDAVFVLRCNPALLRKRLQARSWSKNKIKENVEAELLDIITAEALCKAHTSRHKTKIYELDTTHATAKQTARTIEKILSSKAYAKKFKPGKIKWLTSNVI